MQRLYKNFAIELSLLATAALCVIFGRVNMLYVAFAIIMHELAHYCGALICKMSPSGLILHGFGVEMCFSSGESGRRLMFTAMCGPLMSLFLAILGYYTKNLNFFTSNAVIAAINFLPAMPLDGGQVLYCFLSEFFSRSKCRTIMKATGLLTGGFLSVLGLYILCISGFNFSLLFIGIFLIAANTGQMYNPVIETTSKENRSYNRCNVFLIDENLPAIRAANLLPSNAIGAVFTNDGKINGFVTPCFLYRCAEKNSSSITTKKVLSCYPNASKDQNP